MEIFIIIKYILEILEEPPLSLFENLQMWQMWKNIGRKLSSLYSQQFNEIKEKGLWENSELWAIYGLKLREKLQYSVGFLYNALHNENCMQTLNNQS